jgi:anion-transporting  ArsA/GET3 family ATPase
VLKIIGRVVGSNVMSDVIDFLRAFEGMEAGFAERASLVSRLLRANDTAFAVVIAPSPEPLNDTRLLVERLFATRISPSIVFANRLTPPFDAPSTTSEDSVQAWLDDNVRSLHQRANRERDLVKSFVDRMSPSPTGTVDLVEIGEQSSDIHDLEGITRLADTLSG